MNAKMYFKRISLFVLTNLAVLVVLALVVELLGLDEWLAAEVGIGLEGLLVLSALFGFGGAFISLALSKWMAKRAAGVRVIDTPRTEGERWLVSTVERLAQDVGLRTPEVGIFESPDPNAFATGARRNAALVAVSTGLLRSMDRVETEAVLGHEVSHVANGDMVTMTLLQGVLNTFVIFISRVVGMAVDRVIFRQERGYGPGYFIAAILSQVILGILASLIVFWFSRRREFRADAGSAALLGAEPMVLALRRLEAAGETPADLPDGFRAFGIRDAGRLMRLFRTHPPIEDRVRALQRGS